jgi:hypothetical protein
VLNQFLEIVGFVKKLRRQMRLGELSRAPLKLLRFELRGDAAECEWITRPPDAWDADHPQEVGERNHTMQALRDALAIRQLLFTTLPEICSAELFAYREQQQSRELVISGTVSRKDEIPPRIDSIVMRARLYGLRFWLNEGILAAPQQEEYALSP